MKVKSYLGLLRKANGLVIGQDKLKAYKKNINLIILSPNATKNLTDLAKRISENKNCDLIQTKDMLENLINIENCKIVGVTIKTLADAIISQNEEFIILRSKNGK